jgi:hypothetical protein
MGQRGHLLMEKTHRAHRPCSHPAALERRGCDVGKLKGPLRKRLGCGISSTGPTPHVQGLNMAPTRASSSSYKRERCVEPMLYQSQHTAPPFNRDRHIHRRRKPRCQAQFSHNGRRQRHPRFLTPRDVTPLFSKPLTLHLPAKASGQSSKFQGI